MDLTFDDDDDTGSHDHNRKGEDCNVSNASEEDVA
jgi:hypothetical protein